MLTPQDIAKAKEDYDLALQAAADKRAKIIAQADAEGMPQTAIIKATGYSRETIRRLTEAGRNL